MAIADGRTLSRACKRIQIIFDISTNLVKKRPAKGIQYFWDGSCADLFQNAKDCGLHSCSEYLSDDIVNSFECVGAQLTESRIDIRIWKITYSVSTGRFFYCHTQLRINFVYSEIIKILVGYITVI